MKTKKLFLAAGLLLFAYCLMPTISFSQCPAWTQKADLLGSSRYGAVGFSIGGKGYIGTGQLNGPETNDFWEYDTLNNTWSQKANFGGTARYDAVGFSIGNNGYIGTGGTDLIPYYLNDFWEFNPDSNKWFQKADFSGTGRRGAVGFSINGKGYIGTGLDADNYTSDFWQFVPDSNKWFQIANFPGGASVNSVGLSIDSIGYLGLGAIGSAFWAYNPANNTWVQKENFGGGYRDRAVGFSIGSKGYIGTGDDFSWALNDFWEYEPVSNSWKMITPLGGLPRTGAAGFSIGPYGFVGTGSDYDGIFLQDFWKYDPSKENMNISLSSTNASCGSSSNGTATAIATGAYSPFTFSWDNGQTTSTATGLTPGSHSVVVSNSIGCSKNATVYIGVNEEWNAKAIFGGLSRFGAVGFSIGEKGYLGTGYDSVSYKKDFWEYNDSNNTWSQKSDFGGSGRYHATGIAINGKGYVGTGIDTSGGYTNDFWEYDPTGNSWLPKSDFPGTARYGATGFTVGNFGYLGTGKDSSGNKNDFYEYNPGSDSWLQKNSFVGSARYGAVAFSVGIKGYIGTGKDSVYKNDFWVYDPSLDTWTQITSFPSNRYFAIGISGSNYGYVGSGYDGLNFNSDFYSYNTLSNSWTTMPDPQMAGFTGRFGATGFSIGDFIYIGTGYDWDNTYRNDFYSLFPNLVPIVSLASKTDASCISSADGSASISASNGTPPYTYSWDNGSTSNTASGLAPGTINANVSDSLNCVSAIPINISYLTAPWMQKANFSGTARNSAAGFSIGTKGYIGTGEDGNGWPGYKNDFWEFNPDSNIWSQKADFGGSPRKGAIGFSIGNKGYIGTGKEIDSLGNDVYLNDFWEYNPDSNSWTRKADLTGGARWYAAGFSITGKGYIGTGQYYDFGYINYNDLWEYNPGSDTWISKSFFPGGERYAATGISIGNKGYLGLGYGSGIKNDFWEFDPVADSWTQKANFGGGYQLGASGFALGNKGYVGTGYFNNATDFWEYNTATDVWTRITDFAGSSRYFAVGFSIGSKGYIGTGYSNIAGSSLNDFWEYDPTRDMLISFSQNNVSCTGNSDGSVQVSVTDSYLPLTYQWSNGQTDSAAANLSVGTYTLTVTDSAKCRNIQQYNIAAIAGAWKQKTGIPGNTVAEAVGFSVGGFGYIGDGTYDFGYRPSYFQYNPATNTWSGMQSLYDLSFQERKSAFAFTVGSNAYVGAGESYGNPLSDFYEFSGTWNQKNDLSFFGIQSRWDAVAFAISTKGYMGTGWSLGGPLKDFWEYNPGSDSWAQLADFGGTARSAATGFSVSGKGYIGTGNDGSLYNDFWEYNPVGNTWTQKAPFAGTARSNAVGISIGTKGYIGTGYDNSGYTNDFWEYEPVANAWTKKSDLPGVQREGAVGFTIGTKGYLGFGRNSSYLGDFWEYDPSQDMSLNTAVTNVSCYNDSTGLATASVSSGSAPYTYAWNISQTNSTASALPAGTYYVTVSDTNSCSLSDTIIITQPASGISYSTSHQDLQCNGNNNGSVSVAASGGTGTLSYSWSNGITSATSSNLVAANYLLTITDSNGCTKTTTVPVIEPPAITISSTLTNVSCMTGNDGSINTTASGGAGALIYQWTTGDSVATLSNLTAGNYTLTVTDDSNCVKTSLITVTEPPILSTSLIPDSVNCSGTNSGSINLSPSGGTPAYSYLWSNSAVTQDISNIFSGTYYVTVKDINLCTKTDSIYVGQPGLLTSNVTKTDVSCKGLCDGTATANLTGGTPPYFYSWQTTPPKTTQTASALCPGTYTVNLSDANNCQATPSITITEPNLLTVAVSSVNPACGISNGTALASPLGGNIPYTFIWSNTATASSITGLSPNTYSVTVTDLRNCDTSASVILTAPSGFPITLSSTNVTCGGLSDGTVNLTTGGGTPPYTFNWNNGSVSEDLSGISGGNYLVTVTDTNNCVEVDSAYVNELAPVIILKNIIHVLCFGNANGSINTTITGGVFPYLYNWSNGLSMDDITGLDTGIYYLTVTDDSGCTALDTSEITQPQQLTAATGKMDVSCYGFCDGVANVTPSGGTLPYVFVWSDPFAQTNSSATGLCPGSYNVNVSDVNNCQATPGVTISEPPPLFASVTASDATCYHSDGSTEVNAGGGTSPYSFFWSNGASASLNSGLYAATYFVTVTDDKGCDTAATGIVGTTAVTQDICLVTVDSATGKNLVVWEKTAGLGTDYFIIYREDTVLNQYDSIGFVPFNNLSEFVDIGSLPKIHSDRYAIATVDSCGNKSAMSAPHKTMHLAVVYNIDGFTRELLWENYEGFSFGTYSIYRGLAADSIVYVGSVVSTTTQYSDADSVNGADSLFYIVSVIHPAGGCNATMKLKTYNASKSNTAETAAPLITVYGMRVTGYRLSAVVYPNPSFEGKFMLAMMAPEKDNYSIEITNAIGQKIFSENLKNISGNYLKEFDLFEFGGGVYSIHVTGSKVSAVSRVVVL